MRIYTQLILLGVLTTLLNISGSEFFVDKSATGLRNGSSWENAWTAFNQINWTVVQPGDWIYISGGPTSSSKVYNETLIIGKNGTQTLPITIAVKANDPNHNGLVAIDNNHTELSGRSYINFDGYVDSKPIKQSLQFQNFYNTNIATYANSIMAPNTTGISFHGVCVSNVNNGWNLSSATGFRIRYCTAKQVRGDAIVRASSAYGDGYEGNIIEWCDFEVVVNQSIQDGGGPDGIQTGNNITARNNTFRVRQVFDFRCSNQHPDFFQAPGKYLAIYNNHFINVGDSSIALGSWWAGVSHQHIKIFNNIFEIREKIDPYPEFIRIYNNVFPIVDVSNLLIANNLFVNNPNWNNLALGPWGPNATTTASNNFIIGNIFVDSGGGGAWTLVWLPTWTDQSWKIDGNLYYPGSYVKWKGVAYPVNQWITNEPKGKIGLPKFLAYAPYSLTNDFRLDVDDTLATGNGITLAAFDFDKLNRKRTDPWAIGPHINSGLVLTNQLPGQTNTPPPPPPVTNPPPAEILAPYTPGMVSPSGYATGVSLTPILTATIYKDPADIPFAASEWVIKQGTTIVHSAVLGPFNTMAVPAGMLNYNTTYNVCVRYKNAAEKWSGYSNQGYFTTIKKNPGKRSRIFNIGNDSSITITSETIEEQK